MAPRFCLCIVSPLCHSVWAGSVSNFKNDTKYQDLLLFIVRYRDEALEIPLELLFELDSYVEPIDVQLGW